MIFDEIVHKEQITKGWSCDKKYMVTASNGLRYLLRISPQEKYNNREALFKMLKQVAAQGIPMCRPIEFGTCEGLVYTLHTWIDGKDAEDIIPTLPINNQYTLGIKSGEILKKIHSIQAPVTQEPWHTHFNRKTHGKIKKYQECGIRFEGDEKVIEYLKNNRDIFNNRPQTFQHGDYHIGNMMMENGEIIIIDFDRFDFGDPWEEFNRIVWCAQLAPYFAKGMVDGYFDANPPLQFWQCLAFYIGSNTLSSVYWAMDFGESDIKVMMDQSKDVLSWYDNFKRVIPSWYTNTLENNRM